MGPWDPTPIKKNMGNMGPMKSMGPMGCVGPMSPWDPCHTDNKEKP